MPAFHGVNARAGGSDGMPPGLYFGSLCTAFRCPGGRTARRRRDGRVRVAGAGCLGILLLLPASELAVQAINYLVTRLLSPGVLPKMSSRKRASRRLPRPGHCADAADDTGSNPQ
jgi:hypothetical protein